LRKRIIMRRQRNLPKAKRNSKGWKKKPKPKPASAMPIPKKPSKVPKSHAKPTQNKTRGTPKRAAKKATSSKPKKVKTTVPKQSKKVNFAKMKRGLKRAKPNHAKATCRGKNAPVARSRSKSFGGPTPRPKPRKSQRKSTIRETKPKRPKMRDPMYRSAKRNGTQNRSRRSYSINDSAARPAPRSRPRSSTVGGLSTFNNCRHQRTRNQDGDKAIHPAIAEVLEIVAGYSKRTGREYVQTFTSLDDADKHKVKAAESAMKLLSTRIDSDPDKYNNENMKAIVVARGLMRYFRSDQFHVRRRRMTSRRLFERLQGFHLYGM